MTEIERLEVRIEALWEASGTSCDACYDRLPLTTIKNRPHHQKNAPCDGTTQCMNTGLAHILMSDIEELELLRSKDQ